MRGKDSFSCFECMRAAVASHLFTAVLFTVLHTSRMVGHLLAHFFRRAGQHNLTQDAPVAQLRSTTLGPIEVVTNSEHVMG